MNNYGESREQLPPSYIDKVSKDENLNVRCEMCNGEIYIFDSQPFYQYEHVCNECVQLTLEANKL
jgi:hypothetical protein